VPFLQKSERGNSVKNIILNDGFNETITEYNESTLMQTQIKTKNVSKDKFVVKSVYLGGKDIHTALINIAEKKAIREMGLDSISLIKE